TTAGFTLTVDGAASMVNTTQFTDVDTLGIAAQNGGVINLPNVASLTGNNFTTNITANGAGSQVNFTGLTALAGGTNFSVVQFQGQAGGLIDLHAVTQVTSGSVQFRAFDPNTIIDLTGLPNYTATQPSATLEAHNGAKVKVPNLTTTAGFTITD